MKDRSTKIIVTVVVILSAMIGYSVTKNIITELNKPTQPIVSNQSKIESFKNAFISGCKGEKQDFLQPEQMQNFCQCVWNKLYNLYGDNLALQPDTMNRILKTGYNTQETDLMVQCLEPYIE